jgi:hypothetical protein
MVALLLGLRRLLLGGEIGVHRLVLGRQLGLPGVRIRREAVCLMWSWVAKLVCLVWSDVCCFLHSLFGSRQRTKSPIKHVFVLMLENRAFDPMLGFSEIVGTDAVTGATRPISGAAGPKAFNYVDPVAKTGLTQASVEADFKLNRPPMWIPATSS